MQVYINKNNKNNLTDFCLLVMDNKNIIIEN
jgi:hypothetical protein